MQMLWKEHDKLHFVQLAPGCRVPTGSLDPGKEQAVIQGADSSNWNRSSDGLRIRLVGPTSSTFTAHRVAVDIQGYMT